MTQDPDALYKADLSSRLEKVRQEHNLPTFADPAGVLDKVLADGVSLYFHGSVSKDEDIAARIAALTNTSPDSFVKGLPVASERDLFAAWCKARHIDVAGLSPGRKMALGDEWKLAKAKAGQVELSDLERYQRDLHVKHGDGYMAKLSPLEKVSMGNLSATTNRGESHFQSQQRELAQARAHENDPNPKIAAAAKYRAAILVRKGYGP